VDWKVEVPAYTSNLTPHSWRTPLEKLEIIATGYRGRLTEFPTIIRIITALGFYRLSW